MVEGAGRTRSPVTLDDPEFTDEPPAPEGPDYADREQAALRHERLHQAVAELPKGQKDCLRLWMEGFTFEEIARSLRVTLDAVKSRLTATSQLVSPGTATEFAASIEEQRKKLAAIAQKLGVKAAQ